MSQTHACPNPKCALQFTPHCLPCVAKTGVRCPRCGTLAQKMR